MYTILKYNIKNQKLPNKKSSDNIFMAFME